jgi:sensor histidine kinase regulating citrate/malate metabolism
MSKIYDALIKLEKKRPHSGIGFSRRWRIETANPLDFGWKETGLESKIIGAIVAMMVVFGLLLMVLANNLIGRAIRSQIDQRALVMATNLSDAAGGYVIGKNILELHALVTKYARIDGSAYAFIDNGKGQILAHSLRNFPADLGETVTMNERRQINRRVVELQGKTVYETRAPILDGQLGTAHIGIWAESVATEIYSALFPIVGLITILLLSGAGLFFFLAPRIIRRLTAMEDKTRSDLEAPVEHRLTG